jgi:hypothetical protein
MDTISYAITQEVRQDLRSAIAEVKAKARAEHMMIYSLEVCCTEWPVEVAYNYFPAERRAWDHPGYPAEVELVSIVANGIDIRDALPKYVIDTILEELGDGKPAGVRRNSEDY